MYYILKNDFQHDISFLAPTVENMVKTRRNLVQTDKKKQRKKYDKQMSQRDKLKEKMKRLNPHESSCEDAASVAHQRYGQTNK